MAFDATGATDNARALRIEHPIDLLMPQPGLAMENNEAPMPVRERILVIARDLILSRGFSTMSVETICAQAGVTKGGFFHHFSSKEALGKAVMHKFWADAVERLDQVKREQYSSQLDYVVAYLDHAIHCYQDPKINQGCMLAIFTMGLADTNPGLYKISQQCFEEWRAALVEMFEELKLEQKSEQFDALAWSELYIATLEGALLLAKSTADAKVIVRTLSLFKQQLMGSLAP